MNMPNQVNRLRSFMFFFHSTGTIIIGFLPLFLQAKGLSNSEIGWILAIGPAAAILAQPLWGFLSDKYKSVKRMLVICLVFMILSSILMFSMNAFITFMMITFIFFSFMSPVAALADSLAQKTANQLGVTFGSIRMWGAVGFALASLACGKILTIIGISNIMYPFLFFAIISLFLGFFVQDVPLSSKPVTLFSALHLLKNKQLLLFLTLITFISLTHRTNDNFIGLHISHLGGDASLIGWAWFIAVITEAIVFALSSLWFRRFNELTFIIIAGFFYVLRFIVIAQATDPIHVLYIQPLHGICFGLFYTAAFQYITKIVPEELQGTGHLLFVSVSFGVSGIVGSSIGGMIMEATSGSALFAALAGSALLGSIGIILCQKKLTSNSL